MVNNDLVDLVPLPKSFNLASLPSEWNISEEGEIPKPVIFGSGSAENSGFVLRSGQYEVVLVVDAMEVSGGCNGGKKNRKHFTIDELESLQVNKYVRHSKTVRKDIMYSEKQNPILSKKLDNKKWSQVFENQTLVLA